MCLKDAVRRLAMVVKLQEKNKDGMSPAVNDVVIERSDIEDLAGGFGLIF